MGILLEFRIVMPLTLEQYQRGAKMSYLIAAEEETKNSDGVEPIKSEEYEKDGEFFRQTEKIYYLQSHLPGFVSAILPTSAMQLHEKSTDKFPQYAITQVTNPFLEKRLTMQMESWHFADDEGEKDNVFNLSSSQLKEREIIKIDFVEDEISDPKYYKESHDPTKCKSEKAGFGPWEKGSHWQKNVKNKICCYKLFTGEFKMWGFQTKMENLMKDMQRNVLLRYHKQIICWADQWWDMSLHEIRDKEVILEKQLKRAIQKSRGEKVDDDDAAAATPAIAAAPTDNNNNNNNNTAEQK